MTPHQRRWLLLAIGFSIVVRLGMAGAAHVIRDDPGSFLVPDSERYIALAQSLVSDGHFAFAGEPELFRLPGLPLLLALPTLAGVPVGGLIVIQAILGGLTTWLCFGAGRLVGGPRAGVVAAWLYAVDPGQWAWSTLVLTETLFTTLVAGTLFCALRSCGGAPRLWLYIAVVLAAAAAYVRLVGYFLPFAVIAAVLLTWLRLRAEGSRVDWRALAGAAAVVVVLIGAWHVRNATAAGYWGFSTQADRSTYFMGAEIVDARQAGRTSLDAVEDADVGSAPTGTATASERTVSEVRSQGLRAIAQRPGSFLTTYVAGIGTTLVHPGTAALMRPFTTHTFDNLDPSAGQMAILGRWAQVRATLARKSAAHWIVSGVLVLVALGYIALFTAGLARTWREPLVGLTALLVVYFVALAGGPDGDARRRAPMAPMVCVVAAAGLIARRRRSRTPVHQLST